MRYRTGTIAVVVAALAWTACAAPVEAAVSRDRYAVGDSVMLGARTTLKGLGFGVDAAVSRQAYSGPGLIRKAGSRLPENVVVHLGTNGTFPLSTCRSIVKAAGRDRRVFFVTIHVPRSWQNSNNKVIRQCDASFTDRRVHVVDWNWAATRHPSWLYADRTHLRPDGAKAFARIIDTAIDTAIADDRAAAKAQAAAAAKAQAMAAAAGSGTAGLAG